MRGHEDDLKEISFKYFKSFLYIRKIYRSHDPRGTNSKMGILTIITPWLFEVWRRFSNIWWISISIVPDTTIEMKDLLQSLTLMKGDKTWKVELQTGKKKCYKVLKRSTQLPILLQDIIHDTILKYWISICSKQKKLRHSTRIFK